MEASTIPFLLARVAAPLTVQGKPVVADFLSVQMEGPAAAPKPVVNEVRGRLYRDRAGRTRTDILVPSASGDSVAISILWDPSTKTMTLISYPEHTTRSVERPAYPSEDKWMGRGPFFLKFTDEMKTIHGLECTRVSLVSTGRPDFTGWQNETWVASDWGLVMLDVADGPTGVTRWEVVRLERVEPQPFIFDVPEDFLVR
jgi:hypothetical protein